MTVARYFGLESKDDDKLNVKNVRLIETVGWLWFEGSMKLQVSSAKEPYKTYYILQKRPIIQSILLSVATPYDESHIMQN